jgi:hypothetical protein
VRLDLRRPGREIENIRDHRANRAEAWFLFLDTGVALGGFLWLVLPQYQQWRQAFGVFAIQHHWKWVTTVGPSWLMSVHPARAEVFLWLDFIMIIFFMVATMAVMTAVLALLTTASAYLARRAGAQGHFGQLFTELGYQYAPIALSSLIIGLGAQLLEPLRYTSLGEGGAGAIRGGLFMAGLLWSIWLGVKILERQNVAARLRVLPLLPGIVGSLFVGLGWWPAIFGL